MSLMVWIVLGLLGGFIGGKLMNKRGEGGIRDIFLGITGAVMSGFVFSTFRPGASPLTVYSLLVSTTGAVALLVLYHSLRRSSS